jgi:hypothetical protein
MRKRACSLPVQIKIALQSMLARMRLDVQEKTLSFFIAPAMAIEEGYDESGDVEERATRMWRWEMLEISISFICLDDICVSST